MEANGSMESYKDRRGCLIGCGIMLVLCGAAIALLAVAILLFVRLAPHSQMGLPMSTTCVYAVFYGVVAALFCTLGIGSMMARRWARALILILASYGLLSGVLALPLVAWTLFHVKVPVQQAGTADIMPIVQCVVLVVIGCIYIVAPGALVFFYRSSNVKATCEAVDSKRRWTDNCPLPVLAIALLQMIWGVCMFPLMAPMRFVILIGPWILHGWMGAMAIALLSSVMLVIGIGMYRVRIWAWWSTVTLTVLVGGLASWGLCTHDIAELYRVMGYSQDLIAVIQNSGGLQGRVLGISTCACVVALAVYLLFIRRYFVKDKEA